MALFVQEPERGLPRSDRKGWEDGRGRSWIGSGGLFLDACGGFEGAGQVTVQLLPSGWSGNRREQGRDFWIALISPITSDPFDGRDTAYRFEQIKPRLCHRLLHADSR